MTTRNRWFERILFVEIPLLIYLTILFFNKSTQPACMHPFDNIHSTHVCVVACMSNIEELLGNRVLGMLQPNLAKGRLALAG